MTGLLALLSFQFHRAPWCMQKPLRVPKALTVSGHDQAASQFFETIRAGLKRSGPV
jgi:hypothetical protein